MTSEDLEQLLGLLQGAERWETFGAGGKEEGHEEWWTTGLWAGSGLAVVYTWIIYIVGIVGVGKLLTVWCIGYPDLRVNLCMDALGSTHQAPGRRGIYPH